MSTIIPVDIDNIETQILLARALRTAFCETQSELLKGSWMSDEMVLERVREMQAQHREFHRLTDSIKLLDETKYNQQILGLAK